MTAAPRLLLSLAALLAFVAAARAETINLSGDLKAANEVPPNSSPATGHVDAVFDTTNQELSWTVTYSNLTGPATGAHFHGPSEQGKNAGIILPFKTVQSPIQGTATIPANQVDDMLAGKWYANIHTSQNPGGEIRGQLLKKTP